VLDYERFQYHLGLPGWRLENENGVAVVNLKLSFSVLGKFPIRLYSELLQVFVVVGLGIERQNFLMRVSVNVIESLSGAPSLTLGEPLKQLVFYFAIKVFISGVLLVLARPIIDWFSLMVGRALKIRAA